MKTVDAEPFLRGDVGHVEEVNGEKSFSRNPGIISDGHVARDSLQQRLVRSGHQFLIAFSRHVCVAQNQHTATLFADQVRSYRSLGPINCGGRRVAAPMPMMKRDAKAQGDLTEPASQRYLLVSDYVPASTSRSILIVLHSA
ncbi:hypothetical protein AC579_5049 [Pseudocercospora musae]|uniref:Uncharacterized protein n=1 Tax=Pseudocercospora musae TaxID=113226 RepID=A0A139GUC9_9PEZI|nr:hypothetical protein AC579_5049 [Pseudocercospora musae]